MRILFTFVSGSGHFNPLVPVARAAVAAGHTVAVAGSSRMVPAIEAAGFTAFSLGERPRTGPPAARRQPERMPVPPVDPAREDRKMRDGFAAVGGPWHAAAILDLAREWKPEILVRDEVEFGAVIAAEVLGIPCATVIVLSAGGMLRPEVVAEPLHELRAEYGLPPDPGLDMLTRGLALSPCPPSFRYPGFPLPANTFSYRPGAVILAGATSRPPTVYVTFGTEFGTIDLVSRVLGGINEIGVNAVVTVGEHIDPAQFGPMPDHIRIEKFIAQELLLSTCDLVVSHGGSGTVLGTLAHGLPSVLLPMAADQPHNARRCADLGTALVLDPVGATPEEISAALSAVLADQNYRRAAERFQDETNALPDVEQTIPLLERLR